MNSNRAFDYFCFYLLLAITEAFCDVRCVVIDFLTEVEFIF